MAAYEKSNGRSLFEKLIDLYTKYGYYKENLISITKKGKDGTKEIAAMMEGYRNTPPKKINGFDVVRLLDYEQQKAHDLLSGITSDIDLPKSNVLQFILSDGSKISARPSGTEPKIKFYFSVNGKMNGMADYENADKILAEKIQGIISDMSLK
jgi:phosphoglucomutase